MVAWFQALVKHIMVAGACGGMGSSFLVVRKQREGAKLEEARTRHSHKDTPLQLDLTSYLLLLPIMVSCYESIKGLIYYVRVLTVSGMPS